MEHLRSSGKKLDWKNLQQKPVNERCMYTQNFKNYLVEFYE